jgi:hypothetical protein
MPAYNGQHQMHLVQQQQNLKWFHTKHSATMTAMKQTGQEKIRYEITLHNQVIFTRHIYITYNMYCTAAM